MRILHLILILILCAGPAVAEVVTFESLPDGSPMSDGLLITDQFAGEPTFLRFEMLDAPEGVAPMVAQVGPPATAFHLDYERDSACDDEGPNYNDMPLPSEDVGCFFLTDAPAPDGDWTIWTWDLRVTYVIPVNYAAGDIIDIEWSTHHQESFTIRAIGTSGQILDQLNIDGFDDGVGEGVATHWEFQSNDLIQAVDFIFTDSQMIAGVAFDNFTPGGYMTSVEDQSWSAIKQLYR